MLPKKSKKIKYILRDKDTRGTILSIFENMIKNVSIITSNKNTIRSNHYHKKDWHYMYILEGKMDYFYKHKENVYYLKLKKGDLIFTPPKEIHSTYFPIKTVMIVGSKNPRDKKTYENDTVRVEFVNNRNISSIKKTAKEIV